MITNNHFRGQAVVNALEIKATLTEEKCPAPAPLFQKYPRLADSAVPEGDQSIEPMLFKLERCDSFVCFRFLVGAL